MTFVLAHQGGWDEMLFVLVPIGIFAWLLSLANKRAIRDQADRVGAGAHGDPDAAEGDDEVDEPDDRG